MRAFHLASVVKKQIVVRFEGDSDILNAFDRDLASSFYQRTSGVNMRYHKTYTEWAFTTDSTKCVGRIYRFACALDMLELAIHVLEPDADLAWAEYRTDARDKEEYHGLKNETHSEYIRGSR